MPAFGKKRQRLTDPKLLEQNQFEGSIRVETFVSEDETFKIITFQTKDGSEFKAKGNLFGSRKGEPIRITGSWKDDPKYGWTFLVESYIAMEPTGEDAMLAYLGSGLVKGLGREKARKVIERFGDRVFQVLDETPELLLEVPGIGRKTLRQIIHEWEKHRAEREALVFLKKYNLSNAIALRLLKYYGEQAAAILRTDPYRAGLEVPMIGFFKADEIAAKLGIEKRSPQRIRAAFVHLLDRAANEGHTYLTRELLVTRAVELLGVETEDVERELAEAVQQSYIKVAAVGEEAECYFMPSLFACESGVVRLLAELVRQARPVVKGNVDDRIAHFEQHYRFQLAPQQQDAIRSAVSGGICVITGGPGTGKTTLVRALLHIVKEGNIRFALCSPTGRAAQRLSETTGKAASTVHRLLKWNAETAKFMYNRENPLPVDLLIVDEASMLDIPLSYGLLRAIPAGATVVFVGDVDQLPSVGAGTFLRDIITSGRAKVTRLEVIFRQAEQSYIIRNSHRINQGQSLQFPDPNKDNADFFFVERTDPEEAREVALKLATVRIPKRLGCNAVDGVQILTPMRRGGLGTHELNLTMQVELNPNGVIVGKNQTFRIGDKVIQTSNNYDLDVYNGDVGIIRRLQPESRQVCIQFGKRSVFYPQENLDELELAYAITIHKSQGSEYPAVVVIIHTSHYIMLKRNLLYTAVTRGKKLVVIVGNKRALYTAIRTSPESERLTALGEWLLRPPDKDDLFA